MTVTNDFFNRLPGVWQNKLNGQWQDSFGWNLISQPKLNEPGDSDFKIRVDQMQETITFKKIGIARNIGIKGEAGFWQSMSYEIDIKTPDGEGIHHEMGHFLLKVLENGETQENLRGDIIRQATIPRANAMMTTGELRPEKIADAIANQGDIPFYNGKPETNDPVLQETINTAFSTAQQNVTQLGGPDLQQPLQWLQNILAENPTERDWVFSFRDDKHPSQMANGQRVNNPVSIGNLLSDFWIARRVVNEQTINILQYTQKVNLGFNGIEWPHVAINSLIKQP